MKGRLHLIADDLGCLSAVCPCASDAWLVPLVDVLVWEIQRSYDHHEAFERYLKARGS